MKCDIGIILYLTHVTRRVFFATVYQYDYAYQFPTPLLIIECRRQFLAVFFCRVQCNWRSESKTVLSGIE